LIAKIVDNLLELTQNLQNKAHFKRYNEKCFTIGKKIKVLKGDDFYYANALSVDDDGRLVVKNESGEIITLYNEEVSTTVE
jgi:BirA family biotin operon repressor/biotin-[acetyl-CoA-carboxylase] ligase